MDHYRKPSRANYYYICPQKDEAKGSCKNKSISSKALKDEIFKGIHEEIQKATEEQAQALKYEKSIQYKLKCKLYAKRLEELDTELNKISKGVLSLYEAYVDDLYTKMDYKNAQRLRNENNGYLKSKIDSIKMQQALYKDNFSSQNSRITALLKFKNETNLTEEMYGLVERCVLYNGKVEVIINM